MDQTIYHIPALLAQTIEGLCIVPDGIYVDVTYGGAGHSKAIIANKNTRHLYAFDQDAEAVANALESEKFTMIRGNFRYLKNFLRYYGVQPGTVSGILADLGVSFHHFDDSDRGFSFRWDGKLDMRMNQNGGKDAAQLIAESTEDEIADILYLYGELKNARKLAAAINKQKNRDSIETVQQLLDTVKPLINPKQEKKELAQIFQAFRIAVNDELGALREMLTQAVEMLKPGGRLAIITYHSLEDRIVKNFMKTGNFEGKTETDFFGRKQTQLRLITNKPIVPDEKEIETNPRSRSAKLRIAEKLQSTKN